MSDDQNHIRRAFLAAELAYRKACRALWDASGTTNGTWEDRTRIELAARRYTDAADHYRSQTRRLLGGNSKGRSEGNGVSPPHSIK